MESNPNNHQTDVALLTPVLAGGVGLITITLAEEMKRKGIKVEIWALRDNVENNLETSVPIYYIPTHRASRALPGLISLIRNRRPTTVLSASYHINCMVILARIISRANFRLAIVEHTSLTNGFATISPLKRMMAQLAMRLCYRFADAWIAVSRDAARQMEQFAGLPTDSAITIYNPVINKELFKKSTAVIEHPFFSLGEPILLSIGRMSPEKDYPNLLQAFSIVNETTPARLIMAGDGPEMPTIKKTITTLGIQERVSLLGHVSNPYPLYTKADVFVLSSTREGLPTVLIEALALGCKVVSTDARSGPREILQDGAYGELVPIEDSVALAQAIERTLTSDSDTPKELSLAEYEIESAVHSYLEVLGIAH